jgi:surface antigen
MAITQAMCTLFKKDALLGDHHLDTDDIYIALYTSSASLDAATDAADPEWTSASFTARGALIYNKTLGDASSNSRGAIAVLNFGGDFTVAGGTFKIVFPAATASNAIVRID